MRRATASARAPRKARRPDEGGATKKVTPPVAAVRGRGGARAGSQRGWSRASALLTPTRADANARATRSSAAPEPVSADDTCPEFERATIARRNLAAMSRASFALLVAAALGAGCASAPVARDGASTSARHEDGAPMSSPAEYADRPISAEAGEEYFLRTGGGDPYATGM